MLLDISIPGIDGLEFCRIIRGLPNFSQLPIVMLTAFDIHPLVFNIESVINWGSQTG